MMHWVVFPLALGVYVLTLCPTIYVGDSGELVTAAHSLGIAHPTGYPLYLLAVKGFAWCVPWESFAFRANLFSAVCAAMAAQMFAGSMRRLFRSTWVGVGAGLLLATLAPVWTQATVARVYPLSLLFSVLLLDLFLRAWHDPRPRWWVLHHLVLGLGLANHTMVIAHAPMWGLAFLFRPVADGRRWRPALLATLALLPGLGIYSYLPVRAAADPDLTWLVRVEDEDGARMASIDEPDALMAYVRREGHHARKWATSMGDAVPIVQHHVASVRDEWTWLGVAFLVGGVVVLIRRRMFVCLAAAGLLWAINLTLLGWHGAWWDIFLYPRYMMVGWLATAFVGAAGLAGVVAVFRRSASRVVEQRGPIVVLALPVVWWFVNGERCDRSEMTLADDYARALLAELPESSQFASTVDTALYPMLYRVQVEGHRPDVAWFSPNHFSAPLGLAEQLSGARSAGPSTRLFTTDPRAPRALANLPRRHVGLVDEVVTVAQCEAPLPPWKEPWIPALKARPDALDAFSESLVGLIHAQMAEAWVERGNEARALEHLDALESRQCGRPWGYFAGVQLCVRLGDVPRGMRLVALAEEYGDPRDPALEGFRGRLRQLERGLANHARAERLTADGKLTEAMQAWQRAVRQAALHTPTVEAFVEAALAQRRMGEARAAVQAAIGADPTRADLYALARRLETTKRPPR